MSLYISNDKKSDYEFKKWICTWVFILILILFLSICSLFEKENNTPKINHETKDHALGIRSKSQLPDRLTERLISEQILFE